MVNAPASHARDPRFKPQRLHSFFSLKLSDFEEDIIYLILQPLGALPEMGQARIEFCLFIKSFIDKKESWCINLHHHFHSLMN